MRKWFVVALTLSVTIVGSGPLRAEPIGTVVITGGGIFTTEDIATAWVLRGHKFVISGFSSDLFQTLPCAGGCPLGQW
jgi:hypothetical protein